MGGIAGGPMIMLASASAGPSAAGPPMSPNGGQPPSEAPVVRTEFPESWIWEEVNKYETICCFLFVCF